MEWCRRSDAYLLYPPIHLFIEEARRGKKRCMKRRIEGVYLRWYTERHNLHAQRGSAHAVLRISLSLVVWRKEEREKRCMKRRIEKYTCAGTLRDIILTHNGDVHTQCCVSLVSSSLSTHQEIYLIYAFVYVVCSCSLLPLFPFFPFPFSFPSPFASLQLFSLSSSLFHVLLSL